MIAFSVLKSFLCATQGNLNSNVSEEEEKSSSGSSDYFDPGMAVCILPPYNFSFI